MSYAQNEEVFYNRVQIFNRDFSILVIRHFIKIREEESTKNHKKKLEHYRGTGSHLVRSWLYLDSYEHNNYDDILWESGAMRYEMI